MRSFLCALFVPFLLSACTATPGTSTRAQFSAPILAKPQWEAETYPSADHAVEFCSIKSGFNGLEVIVRRPVGQAPSAIVRATRAMSPGASLLVSVNGNNYHTNDSEGYFSLEDSKAMIADMEVGKEAYLYWQYPPSGDNPSADKFANKIGMGGFASYYQECMAGRKTAQ